jgi:hypothetical protein
MSILLFMLLLNDFFDLVENDETNENECECECHGQPQCQLNINVHIIDNWFPRFISVGFVSIFIYESD